MGKKDLENAGGDTEGGKNGKSRKERQTKTQVEIKTVQVSGKDKKRYQKKDDDFAWKAEFIWKAKGGQERGERNPKGKAERTYSSKGEDSSSWEIRKFIRKFGPHGGLKTWKKVKHLSGLDEKERGKLGVAVEKTKEKITRDKKEQGGKGGAGH